MKKAVLRKGRLALAVAIVLLICEIPVELYATTTQEKLDQELKNQNELRGEIDENNHGI